MKASLLLFHLPLLIEKMFAYDENDFSSVAHNRKLPLEWLSSKLLLPNLFKGKPNFCGGRKNNEDLFLPL